MTIHVGEDEQGPWTVLHVRGELDLVSSPTVRRRVHDAVAGGRHDVVLDLAGVDFCDSSGVGVLIASRRLMRSCGGRLRLVLPARGALEGSHVNRVLAALGVRRLFDVYADAADAVDERARPLEVEYLAGQTASVPEQPSPTRRLTVPPLSA
ncbi:anti-sigma factor antagonist [Streptomyces sp. QHH-9511]|nr:anti-sigma factor antagonist [Streptomyces sp. QHH-9511]GGT87431.1 anti-sigma factor antagonist [Streptomyces lateritius]